MTGEELMTTGSSMAQRFKEVRRKSTLSRKRSYNNEGELMSNAGAQNICDVRKTTHISRKYTNMEAIKEVNDE